ncbi:MAG: hypothetical protein FVQ84_10760 [Planctomycetes bacterium]|nr:hypothetical protein [Planctomycetota bacterium]
MKFKILSVVVLICMALMLVSCRSFSIGTRSEPRYERKPGPPPHAPAHGYRRKHQGAELVYDSGRGIYVVIDFPNHYYFKGHYYRLGEAQWEVGVNLEGPWGFISYGELPKGLRIEKKGKGKAKGKSKGKPGRGLGLGKE